MRSFGSCGGCCIGFGECIMVTMVVVVLNGGSRYIRIHVDCTLLRALGCERGGQ